jgi:predicted metal-binding membrane protein
MPQPSSAPRALDAGWWHDRALAVLLLVTSGLAWFVLWWWGHSPYLHYLHHAHHHAAPGVGLLGAALIFVAGWTVMTVAMMLPTSVPLISLFSKVARRRPDRHLLVGLVVVGYVLAWAGFGVVAYAAAVAFRTATGHSAWLQENHWVLASGTLALAGLYQLSSLKYRCLDKCRSPFSFVTEHWTGEHHARQALWLGLHHGIFCVGCCWTLMLLMLPFGAASLGWMLVLGILMAVEKNVSWGRRIGKPLGVVLLALAFVFAFRGG